VVGVPVKKFDQKYVYNSFEFRHTSLQWTDVRRTAMVSAIILTRCKKQNDSLILSVF